MNLKPFLLPAVITVLSITMYSCKTKKIVTKPNPPEAVQEAPPVEQKQAETPPPVQEEKPAAVEKPDYNFSNIQFEFNSSILKTGSFPILEKAALEMKKDASAKFILNGHSSAEGTPEHNMSLSVDRANAVKSFLVNTGLDAANFSIKGYGETKPVTSNDTEEGRALNRRVEIKVNQ